MKINDRNEDGGSLERKTLFGPPPLFTLGEEIFMKNKRKGGSPFSF